MRFFKDICPVIADILAFVGFGLALFIAFRLFPNCDNTQFDYQAILVGVISAIFTLLIGWNIFQVVDWKSKIKEVESLREKLNRELNYIHNKCDYNQGVIYTMLCQAASAHFAPNEDNVLKFQMLKKGIVALKIFSRFPDCKCEINTLIKTLIKGLENSLSIPLDDNLKTDLLLSCGEIENRESIEQFNKLIELIKSC